jgi:flavin-binding protein dodecin
MVAPFAAVLTFLRGADSVWTRRPTSTASGRAFLRRDVVPESVYKVIELVGTSTDSWEKAATAAVERASQTLRDLRIAEVVELDMQLDDGKIRAYRAKVKVSFKYEGGD